MILEIVKKQALLFLRNPVQLLLLLGLPIILIAILGAALGNLMSGGEVNLSFKLAVIEHESEQQQIERFINDFETSDLPEEVITALMETAQTIEPVATLLDVFKTDEIEEMITVEEADELTSILEDDSFSAVIEIPANFSYDMLEQLFLDEGTPPEMIVHHSEGEEIVAGVLQQIVTTYQQEYTMGAFLGERGINPEEFMTLSTDFQQEISSINQQNPISSSDYYAIGMVVMNVLFMATTIATFAFNEKKSYIFDRIIIANISRWRYFVGILLSGLIFSFLQILLVFGFAYLVYGVIWPDVGAFFIISLAFAISVGGLGVLLTALSYSTNSEQITNFFSGIVVTLFAFLGGSFFPIGDGSSMMQRIGELTPNGAAMSAYLSILRGETLSDNIHHIIFITCFAVGAIIIGVLAFPKRGAKS
jgi:ABC-2 type transport system permease protein